MLRDPLHHRLERPTHTLPGALRRRRRAPIPPAEPHRARELGQQRLALLFGPFRTFELVQLFGLFYFCAKLRQPPAIGGLSRLVEHGTRIAQTADVDPCALEFFVALW